MRVCIYCRIDDARATPEASAAMDAQYQVLKRYADENGHTVVGELKEYGSGLTLDRRGLNMVTRTLESGEADALLVHSTARIVRESESLDRYLHTLSRYNACVISMTEGVIRAGDIPISQNTCHNNRHKK